MYGNFSFLSFGEPVPRGSSREALGPWDCHFLEKSRPQTEHIIGSVTFFKLLIQSHYYIIAYMVTFFGNEGMFM